MRSLPNSPAEIVAKLLTAQNLVTEPPAPGSQASSWPVYYSAEPQAPDNLVVIYDTQGRSAGRVMQGERQGFYGLQVMVRATSHAVGWEKIDAIRKAMDEDMYDESVTIDSNVYVIHSFDTSGDIMALGKEQNGKRSLFTVNFLTSIRKRT